MPQASFSAEVRGLDEVMARITRLAVRDTPAHVRTGLRAGAFLLQQDAKRRAARGRKAHKINGKTIQPGNLAAHIVVSSDQNADGHTISYQVGVTKAAFYGRFVEFGTSRMAARPFLRPALDNDYEAVISLVVQEILAGVRRGLR